MGISAVYSVYYILQASSAVGIVLLTLQSVLTLANIGCLFWLIVWRPYRRHRRIERMMIVLGLLNIISIVLGFINSFTDGTRIIDVVLNWSEDALVTGIYILELEILLIFQPLSSSITQLRIHSMQVFVIILQILSYGPGYFCFILLVSGATVMPHWIVSWYSVALALGIVFIILCNFSQSAFITRLLYLYITRKESKADLNDEEKEQIQFSRKLVKLYLIWILIIVVLDFITLGLFYFGDYQVTYICNIFLSGRLLEVFAAFSYIIQIPFRTATSQISPVVLPINGGGKNGDQRLKPGKLKQAPVTSSEVESSEVMVLQVPSPMRKTNYTSTVLLHQLGTIILPRKRDPT